MPDDFDPVTGLDEDVAKEFGDEIVVSKPITAFGHVGQMLFKQLLAFSYTDIGEQ
jgi:hypothetical protein